MSKGGCLRIFVTMLIDASRVVRLTSVRGNSYLLLLENLFKWTNLVPMNLNPLVWVFVIVTFGNLRTPMCFGQFVCVAIREPPYLDI